jgi:hypothetical protein
MAASKARKKPAKKKSAVRPKTAHAKSHGKSASQDRVLCFECGRELVISNWGSTERSIYCCGKVMESKK